jgi:FtsP/CotA-like multicopper oxidase with cupredoxin domain
MDRKKLHELNRRELLRLGLLAGGGAVLGSSSFWPAGALAQTCTSGNCPIPPPVCSGTINEVFPTSPLILEPWKDELPIPKALAPDPTVVLDPLNQDSDGGVHQLLPSTLGLPAPIGYRIKLLVAPHSFTSSKVRALVSASDGSHVAGTEYSSLPDSTIYGFNGTFPGPRINAEYGKPALVRFENHLDDATNPYNCLDRQDFGPPDCAFLTHLHNGHTAPESDGQPHYKPGAYQPGEWVDNLYLNWPAAGDDTEKQSFFWFHDHRMDHTGANVYKGMVGLYPIYDPYLGHDMGDETAKHAYRLPGVRTNNADGSFDVEYDIPMAFYDCRLDDGATPHQDFHNGCGETHPEWWGKTFFRHFPNHGFVGDIFTVNGKAFAYKEVKRRRYRLRFLDASIARQYELRLMTGTPQAVSGQLGQYNLFSGSAKGGQQCMKMVQIAPEGGLLTFPFLRNGIEIWPAKRREVIVDFSKYQDGSPTKKGDVIYLTNVRQMSTGRKADDGMTTTDPDGTPFTTPTPDPNYAVPLVKFVIGDDAVDNSLDPLVYANGDCSLARAFDKQGLYLPILNMRTQPDIPSSLKGLDQQTFELVRSGTVGGEIQWLIRHNGGPQLPFDPLTPMAFPIENSPGALWEIDNGGGGWTHPLHIHMEEHRVLLRNGVPPQGVDSIGKPKKIKDPSLYAVTYNAHDHPDDLGKEDVVALDPSEKTLVFRRFRDFTGKYVCHCHNLAHEDHAMMFGWTIVS